LKASIFRLNSLMLDNLPVSIICGYLGSGKTTYINQKLKESQGIRYAVLVNDFGELNIDAALIESETADIMNLVNGCVCCSISNDMYKALEALRLMAGRIDYVLLEASGVADGKKVKALIVNSPGYTLKQCLTLVDVTRIKSLIKDKFVGKHVLEQILVADAVNFTKTDLVTKCELEDFRSWFASIGAHPTSHPRKDHPKYFSASLLSRKPISRESLTKWLDEMDIRVLRLKGFVYLEDDVEKQYLLQYTESSWTLDVRDNWLTPPKSALTMISSEPLSLSLP
jgi:G3E family GTPase